MYFDQTHVIIERLAFPEIFQRGDNSIETVQCCASGLLITQCAKFVSTVIVCLGSPAPLIENPRAGAVGGYGAVVLNPNLGLSPGLPVKLTVRALPRR